MPTAMEVQPEKWSGITVLFDDGRYSVISGNYDKRDRKNLGERWNGGARPLGFPISSGYPVWHVVPEFFEIPILHAILDERSRTAPQVGSANVDAVLKELSYFLRQKRT